MDAEEMSRCCVAEERELFVLIEPVITEIGSTSQAKERVVQQGLSRTTTVQGQSLMAKVKKKFEANIGAAVKRARHIEHVGKV